MKTSAFRCGVVSLFLLVVCIYKPTKKEIQVHNQLSALSYLNYKLSVNCLTISKMLQFLSHAEELEVNERILTAILCKPGVSVPYNIHHDAEKNKESAPY
jgi:hypothetical protein